MEIYSFNSNARYHTRAPFYYHKPGWSKKLTEMNIQVNSQGFKAQFKDIFSHYKMSKITNAQTADSWFSSPMKFWQNQLNFAVWCASGGCGVAVWEHCASKDPMVASLYTFHIYYQTRRILNEMKVPLPSDAVWNEFDNSYDRGAYERLCREFKVSAATDWRQPRSLSNGLGNTYVWGFRNHRYIRSQHYEAGGKFLFNKIHAQTSNKTINIGWVAQGPEAIEAWTLFLFDKGAEGFTEAGVERINDTIRTYVYCLLTAQATTRSSILGTGTAFNAQKKFVEFVENSITDPSDLENRYEQVLKYARSKVDFVFGDGLYMSPSNMEWKLDGINDFSNHVFLSKGPAVLGVHPQINKPQPVIQPPPMPKPQTPASPQTPTPSPPEKHSEATTSAAHQEEKTALVLAIVGVFITLFALK